MTSTPTRVEVGRIVAVHGLRGGLKIESWTQPRNRIFDYQPWTLVRPDGSERCVERAHGDRQGKGMVACLPGVQDREQALALVGGRIVIPRSALPPLADGEYYWADLEGLDVVNTEGIELGRVDHVLATGANEVLVLVDDSGRQRLVPFVPGQYIKEVDLDLGRMCADWDPEF